MEKFVIAITRTCGSGISHELFTRVDEDQKRSILFRASQKVYNGELIPPESDDFTSNNNLFNYQAKVLREMAKVSSYICIGRAADYVLADFSNVIKVYIYALKEKCIQKEMNRQKIDRRQAERFIQKTDKYRRDYYRYLSGRVREDMRNYWLCNLRRYSRSDTAGRRVGNRASDTDSNVRHHYRRRQLCIPCLL